VPISLAARFTAIGAPSRTVFGRLVDVSTHGVGIELDARLEPETVVLIDCKSGLFAGIIRYCRPSGGRYRAGLFLEDLPASRNAVAALRRIPSCTFPLAS
jgi:hypothetical protein